jgi:two-component system sensor histidine kinase/response regulator
VPILAVTANALDWQVVECRRAGIAAHVTKPYSRSKLLTAVARAVGASDPAATIRPAIPMVLDRETLAELQQCLGANGLDNHLRGVRQQIERLLAWLAQPTPFEAPEALRDMLHEITGTAGTFGCMWLALVARQLETAMGTDPSHAAALASTVAQIAAASLAELAEWGPGAAAQTELFGAA